MNKWVKIGLAVVAIGLLVMVMKFFADKNSKDAEEFTTDQPFKTTIAREIVATGKVNPEEEIELKPQVSGIISEILVEEGDLVKKGDLIARIRVVPNERNLTSARSNVNSRRLSFNNTDVLYKRNKTLFEKGIISKQDFENSELAYQQAKQTLSQAQNDYAIIKKGSVGSGASANTNIIAQISGTILEIPVREGNQVIESSTFSSGTTIAIIADMSKMIFEGKVDESEVGKLKEGRKITVKLGAIENKDFPAILTFVAPKGKEESGAVQFTIKADVTISDDVYVRAGYSANADIKLEKKDSVLAIKESLLQFNRITEKPFVEIETEDQKFKKKKVKLGISDGINVEILEGVAEGDKIKVWNKASKEEEESEEDDN